MKRALLKSHRKMKTHTTTILSSLCLLWARSYAFQSALGNISRRTSTTQRFCSSTDIYLTPKLEKYVKLFSSTLSVKGRYMRLLQLAKEIPDAGEEICIAENKVPGCLSTVYIDCTTTNVEGKGKVVHFSGWSDGLLTKGMMSLLLQGLDGHTPDEIELIQPEFIKLSKIDEALTPGRNNGFLNMLNMVKIKARKAVDNP